MRNDRKRLREAELAHYRAGQKPVTLAKPDLVKQVAARALQDSMDRWEWADHGAGGVGHQR